MAIINYPENIFRTVLSAIDVTIGRNKTYATQYSKDITSAAIDKLFSANRNWVVNSVVFNFSTATARNFTIAISNGRTVVSQYNDYLWFLCTGGTNSNVGLQAITLDAGFYTGAQLASHLQTKLNANAAFSAGGLTFTASYNNSTGLFTITPSSGQIKYINRNISQTLGKRDSIAGNLFGLTADTVLGATVVSDTSYAGLNNDSAVAALTANTATSYVYQTAIPLSVDQSLHVTTNTAAVVVTVDVNYTINQ